MVLSGVSCQYLSPIISFLNCFPIKQANVGPTELFGRCVSVIAPVNKSISST